jgi:hypothetical protein
LDATFIAMRKHGLADIGVEKDSPEACTARSLVHLTVWKAV